MDKKEFKTNENEYIYLIQTLLFLFFLLANTLNDKSSITLLLIRIVM